MHTLALALFVPGMIAVAKEFPLNDFLYICNVAGRVWCLEKTRENGEEGGDNATNQPSDRSRYPSRQYQPL